MPLLIQKNVSPQFYPFDWQSLQTANSNQASLHLSDYHASGTHCLAEFLLPSSHKEAYLKLYSPLLQIDSCGFLHR